MKLAILLTLLGLAAVHCSLQVCQKQNGGFSSWLKWSPCDVSCGTGVRRRHRYCDNPMPKYGGAKCNGEDAETQACNLGACPEKGRLGDYEFVGTCTKTCGGGTITKRRSCSPPLAHTGQVCYEDCTGDREEKTEDCNTQRCPHSVDNVCQACRREAVKKASELGEPNFVGHACRLTKGKCNNKNGGIRDMYTANDWFFVHCSPDGPWCKPCATRTLVYNAKCGQCESTRTGACTGPNKWQANTKREKDVLNDEDLW